MAHVRRTYHSNGSLKAGEKLAVFQRLCGHHARTAWHGRPLSLGVGRESLCSSKLRGVSYAKADRPCSVSYRRRAAFV
jgi:hypothetical protein